jgi:hypothetical protein
MEIGYGYKLVLAAAIGVIIWQLVTGFTKNRRKYLDAKVDRAVGRLHDALRTLGVEIVVTRIDYSSKTVGMLLLIRGEPDHIGELTTRVPLGDEDNTYVAARAIKESLLSMGINETRDFNTKGDKVEVSV